MNQGNRHSHNRGRRGQVLIFFTLWLPLLFGMSALVVDFGFLYSYQSELDASTQAAALAGAWAMSQTGATVSSVNTAVQTYSSASGKSNVYSNLPNAGLISGYPRLKCLSTLTSVYGIQCYGPSSSNAIVVAQKAKVPMLFFQLFGGYSATLTSTATAAMKGAAPLPYNVALIVDSTASMTSTDSDSNCKNTRMSCALSGVQQLLSGLAPCQPTSSSCGTVTNGNVANSVDRAALLTFPPVATSGVSSDYDCSSSTNPTIEKYATPFPSTSTYEIVNFSSDFRTSDTATSLSATSNLVKAVNGKSGCSGMAAVGGVGTYYPQAIYAAQAYLVAEQASFPTAQNVMIILGDGDMNATSTNMPGASTTSGKYPSTKQECHQAITAAQAAATAGTKVYTVAYGALTSGCSTDTSPTISPCDTMRQMASSPAYFFSDYTATGGSSSCVSASQPITGLNQIFQTILTDLRDVKLIPNGTT
ncbi:MAG TPA: pilus assembly protein TadG-related protein [Bryobacteraceae bacterium]|nr:pilus assembly protein TadG-related protein [Bryobacteraceae bacterium]